VRLFPSIALSGRLAAGNAELARIAADLCSRNGDWPATPQEARRMLGLNAQDRIASAVQAGKL
jgi:uncharacterized protein (DUF849 family)